MNFSKLFCITLSNNFNLLYRASASSEVLLVEPGAGSCEEMSSVALFLCFSSEPLPFSPSSFCVATSLCSIFLCLCFAVPAKCTASRNVQKWRERFMWRRRSPLQTPRPFKSAVTPPQTPCGRLSCLPTWVWSQDSVLSCTIYLRFTNGCWNPIILRPSSWPSPSWWSERLPVCANTWRPNVRTATLVTLTGWAWSLVLLNAKYGGAKLAALRLLTIISRKVVLLRFIFETYLLSK